MNSGQPSRRVQYHRPAMVFLIVLVWCTGSACSARATAAFLVPAAAYPSGAHIGVRPNLSNARMDCMWGFDCENSRPLFHLTTQQALGRVYGWAQFASVRHHGQATMGFELFASRYQSAAGAQAAFTDFRSASLRDGYHVAHATVLLPPPPGGSTLFAIEHLGSEDLVVMGVQSGPVEIEGVTYYNHRSTSATRTARDSLALQIRISFDHDV